MATIPDNQINHLARTVGLIEPYNPEHTGPASHDVSLGAELLVEGMAVGPEECRQRWRYRDITDSIYLLKPGEFVLGVTAEYVRIPVDMEAQLQLKSSRAREGFNHALAGYIDPGFMGNITLEIHNLNRYHDLILKPGMLMCQLRFMKLAGVPSRSYAVTGHYHGDTTVQASKTDQY